MRIPSESEKYRERTPLVRIEVDGSTVVYIGAWTRANVKRAVETITCRNTAITMGLTNAVGIYDDGSNPVVVKIVWTGVT